MPRSLALASVILLLMALAPLTGPGPRGAHAASAAAPATPGVAAAGAGAHGGAVSPPPIEYRLDLTHAHTQMLDMTMRVPALGREAVELALPTWRPGRYEILDPSGTLREVQARGDGGTLAVRKTAKNRWLVEGVGGGPVEVRYRVYANSIGDRTRHVDDTHAFLSPSSCFLFVPGERDRPIVVSASAPAGWRLASGLPQDPGPRGDPALPVRARDYDELVDSPFEIGLQSVLEFEVAGVPHEIVIWPPDAERHDEHLVADFRAIAEASLEIFGRLPYERYVFMLHVGAGGGGTEHLNSTIMQTSAAALRGSRDRNAAYRRLLGLTAHEFFHVWNVKQFRPAGLKPYDYERENYTDLLWVAEGTTSYYDELLPVRAGIVEPEHLLEGLARQVRSTRSRPGRRVQSLAESSFDAWVVFNRRTPDHVNCSISFYTKGSSASFLLDLEIRRLTEGRASLDDVMRLLFERFPLESRGFTTEDLRAILAEVTGHDFDDFIARYVEGTEPLPLEDAVRTLGLELVIEPARPDAPATDDRDGDGIADRPYLGLDLRDAGGRTVVRSVRSDGPAYRAGLNAGDEIVAMDGRRVSADEYEDFLARYAERARARVLAARSAGEPAPDGRLRVTYFRRDVLREVRVSLDTRPDGRWVLRHRDDANEAERLAWADWSGRPWPGTGETGEGPGTDRGDGPDAAEAGAG